MKRRLKACLAALALLLSGCARGGAVSSGTDGAASRMEVLYAKQFTVDRYDDGTSRLVIGGDEEYLIVPEDAKPDEGREEGRTVIHLRDDPRLYVAASSAMDLFDRIGALGKVAMTSTKEESWSVASVKKAMEDGTITYIGKYSAPDYEAILENGCSLVIESTMIEHSPAVKEKLESLGLPVIVERSSYEDDPLGRMEWIKVFGLLTGREKEAEEFFGEQVKLLDRLPEKKEKGPTVAFFYINSSGAAVVRRPGDYVSKMIERAGGQYVHSSLKADSRMSTVNMQFETFYAEAANADILIYNSTIGSELADIGELLEKNALFSEFKAVKDGNVWCTGNNMFQETSGAAAIICEFAAIFDGTAKDGETEYFHRLR